MMNLDAQTWRARISNPKLRKQLAEIDWRSYKTAYGRADNIPDLLIKLHSTNQRIAAGAACDLEANLCHQHVQLASAAVPALPFILEAVRSVGDMVLEEIMYVLQGIAAGCAADTWRPAPPDYLPQLFKLMDVEREYIESLTNRTDGEIGERAVMILIDLDVARSRLA